jgi:23S rRNA pseudouridine1911/1915/1917 synthase
MGQQNKSWRIDNDGAAISGELHRTLEVSHRQAKGMIDARCVSINGELVKTHGRRLKTGDMIAVNFDSDAIYHELPHSSKTTDSEVNILWEDKHLVFVDKSAGLLSVPTEHSDDASLADALVEYYHQRGVKKPRIYIVHRLDRYTSGVIVFAKTPEALNDLRELFHEHRINRVYKAILVGELPENMGTLHDKLVERTRRLKMAVVAKRTGTARPQGTKPAVTHYRVIERLFGHTVVELKLETGRRNQIRVQFAERGYPLLGDQIYGSASPILERQALHAELLGLRHPITDENITVQSKLPKDMETVLRWLRVHSRIDRAKAGLKGEDGIFKPRVTKERKQDRVMRAKRFDKEEPSGDAVNLRKRYQPESPSDRTQRKTYQGERSGIKDHARPTRLRSDDSRQKTDSSRPNRESRPRRDSKSDGFKPERRFTPSEATDQKYGERGRSEERRVGKECVRRCRSRWSPYH